MFVAAAASAGWSFNYLSVRRAVLVFAERKKGGNKDLTGDGGGRRTMYTYISDNKSGNDSV